ncbi:putative Helix-turn-helix domain-containing protein 4 [Homarus americanus]|uniref:Putative Helix-turn-helix domain-containing protein 4 n=1 Tax=Homarus americanus TaxID=6706 RepID=A0A8J5T2B3_HOMAM|nr:putative Helix-turn-helix domain-containing protein 4 [Homarus americanus]
MASNQEKVQCVVWFAERKPVTTVQGQFCQRFGKEPPSKPSIRAWFQKFLETGSICDLPRSGRPRMSEESIESVREAFQ